MEKWTTLSLITSTYLMLILRGFQLSQPSGYLGCYPDTSAFVRKTWTFLNNGTFCMQVCKSASYRYAGTKDQACKCGNSRIVDEYKEAECKVLCPGMRREHCGGTDRISLYDTKVKEKFNLPECIEDVHGMAAFQDEGRQADSTFLQNNTATLCKAHCKDLRYIFAGTKSTLCICGDNMKTGIRRALGGCTEKCPGDERELCGGEFTISLYRTGFLNAITKITQRPTKTETDAFVTESSTSVNDTVEASSTFVSSEAANREDTTTTTMVAIYISIPVAIVIIGMIVALIIYITLRRRRMKTEPDVKYYNSDNGTGLRSSEQQGDSHGNELKPDSSYYAEAATETTKSEDNPEAEYSAVDYDSCDNLEGNQQYVNCKAQPHDGTNTRGIYSHLKIAKADRLEHIYLDLERSAAGKSSD